MKLSFWSLLLVVVVAVACLFLAEAPVVAGGGQQNIIINNGRQGLFARLAANRAARRANITVNNFSSGGSYQQALRSSSHATFTTNQLNTFNVAPYTQSANIRFSSHHAQQNIVVPQTYRQEVRVPVVVERTYQPVVVERVRQPIVVEHVRQPVVVEQRVCQPAVIERQRIEYQVVPCR